MTLAPEMLEELRSLRDDIPRDFRTHYHRIEAQYPAHWKGLRPEVVGEWFQFGELRPLALHEAKAVVAFLNALEPLLDLAAEALTLQAVAEAAGTFIAERGNVQVKTPLHEALAAYYRHLATQGRKESP